MELRWPYEELSQSDTVFAGGGHAGLQRQWSNIVLGVEVSYTWADIEVSSGSVVSADTSLAASVRNLVMATGRLGYAYERWLAYAKAGYATAEVDFRSSTTSTGVLTTTSSDREHGWTAGIGIEMAVTENISIGAEYDYVRLSVRDRDQTATPFGLPGSQVVEGGIDLQLFMARLNFKFGRHEPAPAK
jgi:outer membrane immunogenic protein